MGQIKDLHNEDILRALEAYENVASISSCCVMLSVYRDTFQCYMMGDYRYECREEHLKKYPDGRVKHYRAKNGMVFHKRHS